MLRSDSLVVVVVVLQILVIHEASHLVSGPHLADVNVLLPPKMTHPVEYRLQGSDGCFKWSWDHHDILSVQPEYNLTSHCSTSARLKSIASYSGRKETAVYATDVHTGIVIRCKIYIDILSRIQIFHNSIKLDLDGLATLRVRAFDDEENVFSSLVGLQFMWQLMSETGDGLSHHLAHVPLKDSPLSDCGGLCGDLDIQIRLEDSGVFSDLYMVKGTGIGHEIVTVHLVEPQFEQMADKIVLTVAEAMSLEPTSPVFVIIGAAVHYTLKVIRGNIPEVVTLPSPFHRWTASNLSVAQVDTMLGKAHALTLGVATIIVEDTRVAGHTQMSSLHVVLPDTLSIYMSPLSLSGDPLDGTEPFPSGLQWYIISGRQYLIQVKVFSQGPGAQEIYLTENDDVKLHDNQSEYWSIFPVANSIAVKHGWWNSKILRPTSCGQGKLMATLTFSSGHQQEKEVIKVLQEVIVCGQVKFSMDNGIGVSQSILLPWAPDIYQEVELKATGGCAKAPSDYRWFSSDISIVSVSASGVIQARKPGKANIRVMSMFDSFNFEEIVVEVSIPSSMVMLPNFPVETVVGSYLQASVTLKASNGAYFYRCDALSSLIRWKTGSDSFTIVNVTGDSFFLDEGEIFELYNMSSYGPPCSWTRVYAYTSGRTMLHATLAKEYQHFDHSFSGSILLKASCRIAAYLPLIVLQAGDGNQFGGYWFDLAQAQTHNQLENLDYLYLAPGTYLDVMFHRGPERWDEGVHFIETVETLGEEHVHHDGGVLVYQLSSGLGSPYGILCRELGTFKLLFRRGNLVGDDHPLPAVAEVNLSIMCSFPSSIVVLIDEAVNAPEVIHAAAQADRSPGRIRVIPTTVANARTIRISAVGIGDSGKAFGNSSSLSVSWELKNCDGLAFWEDTYSLATVKSSWEKFLVLQNASGLCIVRATVIGFTDGLSHYRSSSPFDSSGSVLTDAVRLQLVSNLRVYPEFSLLFFSPDAKSNFSITGGSCFLDAVVNDTQIVEVVQPPIDLQCSQLVLAPKGLGTAVVTVYDIGLTPPLATKSVVQVADVEWIKINSLEEISLMEGTFLSLNVSAGVDDVKVFDSSQYVYMKICVHIENHMVDLVNSNDFPIPVDGYLRAPFFIVWARYLGVTTLYVSARQQSGREILSEPIKIEVYAPPVINPNDIFLVPGASYVLTVRGGPRIGAYVEYASMDDDTATIDKFSGRLSAISPGNTTLVATVYGNGDTMICQAYGRVKVGVPSSAILNSQSEKVAIGRDMPIFPSLSEGNLFSFYELCKNYKWSIENEEVMSFRVAERLHGEDSNLRFDTAKEVSSIGYLDEKNLGFIEVLYGKSAGRTDVAISFTCDFISTSFSQSRSYNASLSLWVESDLPLALGAPITWVLPPYYNTSNVLPSSSNLYERGDIHGRKGTIIYSLLKECGGKSKELRSDAIYIDGGKIKTMESGSIACIVAKDRLTRRTEVAACVRVAEVAQIRITKDLPIHLINLAVGAELDLPVNFHDVSGNPFHEAYNIATLNVETNYPDVVFVNDTHNGIGRIHLKAMHPGRALVRISFNHTQKSDHLMISVGAHLYPVNPVLRLGSHLNFSVRGLDDQASGRWLSANRSVIAVDALSGKVEAIGEGASQVIFEGSNLKLKAVVTVLGGSTVSVDAPRKTLTNVPFPTKGYSFSVKFSNAYKKYEAAGNDMVVTYNCKVDPSFLGYAKPWWDVNTGNSYCLFFPFSPEHLVHSIPKSNDKRQGVSVSVKASLKGADDITGSASALFIGGFSILEMDKNSLHLNLTSDSNTSVITILGNTNVEVHWHERNHLSIIPVHIEDSDIGGSLKFEVRVLGPTRFKDEVIITLPATGQRAEVDVSFEPGERKAVATTYSTSLWAAAVGCFAFLMLIVAIFICFLDKPDRSRLSASPATRRVPTPATPPRSSPADVKEESPRTPQPFLDYVKRTIDETPYYRQEVRRRFNPQNTF